MPFRLEPFLRSSRTAVVEPPGPSRWSPSTLPLGLRLPQLLRDFLAVVLDPVRRPVLRGAGPRAGTARMTPPRRRPIAGHSLVPHLLHALPVRHQEEAHRAFVHEA